MYVLEVGPTERCDRPPVARDENALASGRSGHERRQISL
jgi:hypothetical protein